MLLCSFFIRVYLLLFFILTMSCTRILSFAVQRNSIRVQSFARAVRLMASSSFPPENQDQDNFRHRKLTEGSTKTNTRHTPQGHLGETHNTVDNMPHRRRRDISSFSSVRRRASRIFCRRPDDLFHNNKPQQQLLRRTFFTMSDDSSSTLLNSAIPFLLRSGTVIAGLVAVLGGLLYVKQDSLLYFPEIGGIPRHNSQNPRGYRSPEERQIPYETHMITCADGVRIHAWLLKKTRDGHNIEPNTPTIIFTHGNAGNIGLRLPNAQQMLHYLHANILMVEYRGYGDSDDAKVHEEGLRKDGEAALHFVLNHPQLDSSKIFLFGRSLGGAVAFHMADYAQRQDIPLAGILIENTFLSISAMVDKLMPWLTPIKPLVLRIGWDSTPTVQKLKAPILYLAGSADQIVPHEHMLELFRLAKQSVLLQMHIVEDGTHNETWLQGGQAYWDKMLSFMKQAMSISPKAGEHRIGTSTSPGADTGVAGSSIPTMSNRFVDIAKEAVSGKGVAAKSSKKKKDM